MFFSQKLKKFKILNHCFFSKKGGFSKGIYKSLNCGQGSRDLKKNVRKNLALVSKRLNIDPDKLILMHQTHSNKVLIIKKKIRVRKNLNQTLLLLKLKVWR